MRIPASIFGRAYIPQSTAGASSALGVARSAQIMDSEQRSGGNFELRFDDLHVRGRGFAFPCDAQGHVDLDALSEQARENYLYARALIGRAMSMPVVRVVD
jgi:hypothetical protein